MAGDTVITVIGFVDCTNAKLLNGRMTWRTF